MFIAKSQAILITKNCRKAHKLVCENCHFKELPFSGLREFQEITVISTTTIDSVESENIHIFNFKSNKKHLSIGHLNTHSMAWSFDEFHVIHPEHPFDIPTLSPALVKR